MLLALATVRDHDGRERFVVAVRFCSLDLANDVHAFNHLAKNNMLSIQVGCSGRRQKELRPVRPWAAVRHAQNARSGVLKLKIFIIEFASIDALASSSVASRKVASL